MKPSLLFFTHFIQVAQLAGYVSEHSAYHHGEVSLTGTIVNMAQTFCGSNNLALLTPGGQFGTLYILTDIACAACCCGLTLTDTASYF
jgi:DNA gyrase/topoisomerase IV subunit A